MRKLTPWCHIGMVGPHLYTGMDQYQFYAMAPDGVMAVTTRWHISEYSLENINAGAKMMWDAVDVLATRKPHRIVLAGVPVASCLGRPRTLEILEEITERTGLPSDSSLEAYIKALHHMGKTKVAIATRWPDHLNAALTEYLDLAGIEVVGLTSHGRTLAGNEAATAADDAEMMLRLGRETLEAAPGAEALLLPGGLGFVVNTALTLEEESGIPVLTNVGCVIWSALKDAPKPLQATPDPAWGALFADLANG